MSAVLIEERVEAARELYLGLTIDRAKKCTSLIVCGKGGVEIEELARQEPDKILVEHIDPAFGLRPFQASRPFFSLEMLPGTVGALASVAMALYRLFLASDGSIVEINPLVLTDRGAIVALDAKMTIDDNALFRQADLVSLSDPGSESGLEAEARRAGLNYIKLKGNVGCMVNGAGLAMATMDLIKLAGAEPANFLDVGGGATSEMVKEGLRIILSDPDVQLIFINVFGGILRCDVLARGLAAAAEELAVRLPVIVRLEGTNKEKGQEILAASGMSFVSVDSLKEAAEKIKTEMGRGRAA